MDTLSFALLTAADDVLAKAAAEFGRKDFAQALCTVAGLPCLVRSRPDVLGLKAQCHQALAQWPEAISTWQDLLRVDPGHQLALAQLPRCLQKLCAEEAFRDARSGHASGRYAETLRALAALPAGWQEHPERHRLQGLCHERLGEHGEALRSWTRLLEVDSANVEAAVHLGMCHTALGNADEAARASRTAAERHPANMHAQFQWLFVRVSRTECDADVCVFVAELQRLQTLSGDSPAFRERLDAFKTKLSSLDGVGALLARHLDDAERPAHATSAAPEGLRAVYECFEPLGGNCEFGLVQRRHGAEPLALFRWTSIAPASLIRLARDKFEGFDSPDHYQIDRLRTGEMVLKETRYFTAAHTQLTHSDATPEALLRRMLRRQAFLKRKLLDTLAEGARIFVYKSDQPLPRDAMEQMQEALRPLGARKLLFVMRAGAGEQPGSVRMDAPGRAVGFVSDVMPNTQFTQWDAIVQHAHAAFEGAADR